jgi:hypothetical protein
MPTIPQLIEGRTAPTPQRAIVAIPAPDNSAEQRLTRAAMDALTEVQHKQDTFDASVAESELMKAHVATLNSLTDDHPETYTQRYEAAMNQSKKDSGQLIHNPAVRQQFDMAAEQSMIKGSQAAFELSKAKTTDLKLADLSNVLDSNGKALANAKDETSRMLLIRSSQKSIMAAREAGYIDALKATELSRRTAEQYGITSLEGRPAAERIAAIEGAQGKDFTGLYNTPLTAEEAVKFEAWKKGLPQNLQSSYDYDLAGAFKAGVKPTKDPNDGLFHMPDTFKKPNHSTFSNESKYNGADGFQGGSWGGPNGDQFKPAESVADYISPDNKKSILDRAYAELNSQRAEMERQAKLVHEQNYNQALSVIDNSKPVSGIPMDFWNTLSLSERKGLKDYADSIASGVEPVTDPVRYQMEKRAFAASPQKWADSFNVATARATYSKSDAAHLESLYDSVAKKETKKVEDVVSGYKTTDSIISGRMKDAGVSTDDQTRFTDLVDRQIQANLAETKRKRMPNDEVRNLVDDMLVQGEIAGTSFFGLVDGDFTYWQLSPEQRTKFAVTYDAIPVDEIPMIEQGLRDQKIPVTEDSVTEYYNKLLKKRYAK